jgi:eukaryotic translation initiation factor 2C
MEPTMKYPFNVRSFFTDREIKDIGSGIQLWRGYFQSVRPAIGKMLINVDISTATMYKSGPLLRLCLDFLRKDHPSHLVSPKTTDREFIRLNRFISGMRVTTGPTGPDPTATQIGRVVKKLNTTAAQRLRFTLREGGSMSVADYFKKTSNRPLNFPDIGCVEVGSFH